MKCESTKAYCPNCSCPQGNGITAGATTEAALAERGVESVLFRGKKLMPQTNDERLDGVVEQLVRDPP